MNEGLPAAPQGLRTPALLLDHAVLERNIARMREGLRKLNVPLRPHVKTAKCAEVVRLALQGQPGGITVSTLKEAEFFYSHGVRDILYAVGIVPSKLDEVLALIHRGVDLAVVLDSFTVAQAVAEKSRATGFAIPALIELDVDGHRGGVDPESDELLHIARALTVGSTTLLRGVMAQAAASYDAHSLHELRATTETIRARTVNAAQRLRDAGQPVPVVSLGATPAALFAENLAGITEVRAGVYMFQDLMMAGIGVCAVEDIAVSVLVAVIGHQPRHHWIITDGGWTALSEDRGAPEQGYGLVRDVNGKAPPDELIVHNVNQEHGIIARRDGGPIDLTRYPIGSRLRILPNHACATAAQHAMYHVIGAATPQTWERIRGW